MASEPETMPQRADVHACALSYRPAALSLVRRRVRAVLAEWDLRQEVVEDVLLVISELTTNAVVHAEGPIMLHVRWTDVDGRRALRVEVTDGGPAVRTGLAAGYTDPDEHGRGLGIVSALSARHGVRADNGEFTHWADLVTA